MQHDAAVIPEKLVNGLLSEGLEVEELIDLRNKLNTIIEYLSEKENAV